MTRALYTVIYPDIAEIKNGLMANYAERCNNQTNSMADLCTKALPVEIKNTIAKLSRQNNIIKIPLSMPLRLIQTLGA